MDVKTLDYMKERVDKSKILLERINKMKSLLEHLEVCKQLRVVAGEYTLLGWDVCGITGKDAYELAGQAIKEAMLKKIAEWEEEFAKL